MMKLVTENWPEISILAVIIAPTLMVILLIMMISKRKLKREKATETERRQALEDRFGEVLDVEHEISTLKGAAEKEISALEVAIEAHEKSVAEVQASYKEKKEIYDRMRSELAVYDERLSFAELGIYEPHFDFQDSEKFKEAIREVRSEQKIDVSAKLAVTCSTEWQLNGSVAKGRTKTGRIIRLTLRAFNNECDAAIANARWNNVNAMGKRIGNAHTQINKLNETNDIHISSHYLLLKLEELQLTHEYREKLKQEKDERLEASRVVREEAKLLKDAAQAEKAQEEYQKLLDKARREAGLATSGDIDAANRKVAKLEQELAEAKDRKERAQSMAEMTKSGYVYIISNIGSFGEGIIKIGMTRRLEPHDRVKELGDASVPFLFDTHAMIYSEDAPALEKALHAEYDNRRVNAANSRKEFFKVTVEEVEGAVQRLAPDADFFRDIEAQEFYETIAKRKEMAEHLRDLAESELPNEI